MHKNENQHFAKILIKAETQDKFSVLGMERASAGNQDGSKEQLQL